MDQITLWMAVGIIIASYSVIANDSVQSLGTWIASNQNVPWQKLWITASVVLVGTLWYGWYVNGGDISYGRLDKIPFTEPQWYHATAPLILLALTWYGIPVSTSFLVLSAFASGIVMQQVLMKSMIGYAFAAIFAYLTWMIITWFMNEREPVPKNQKPYWIWAQWFSTMLLWFTWLSHDVANFAVFLPRQVPADVLLILTTLLVCGLAFMFANGGGKIQQIVLTKKHTTYIRSATFIDLIYFLILLFFKEYQIFGKIPMSTTWVFVGLLCGRELAISAMSSGKYKLKSVFPIVGKDFLKMLVGLGASVGIVLAIQYYN
jgi:hypothetical protein